MSIKHYFLSWLLCIFLMTSAFSATQQVYTENFDAGDAGWSTVDLKGNNSLWHKITDHPMDTVSYHSADTSWWCGATGGTYYGKYLNDALKINRICDLSGKSSPRLYFWYYLDIDADSDDSACVDVSTDTGKTWNYAVASWTTSSGRWLEGYVVLSSYIDMSVQLQFRFKTDSYNVKNCYGWFIDDIRLVDMPVETTVYINNFDDSTYAEFTHYAIIGTDDWGLDSTRANSGSRSFHAKLNMSSWTALQTLRLDLSGVTNPQLKFHHWYEFPGGLETETWSNGAIIEITTDTTVDSAAWVKLYPVGGYPGYCYWTEDGNPLGNTGITGDADVEGYYGEKKNWSQAVFDLADYIGEDSVWIRFSSGCDVYDYWWQEQWYVDDVEIVDLGSEDTMLTCDMEDSNDYKFTPAGPVAGDWWRTGHEGLVRKDGSLTYHSADSSKYCGNQNGSLLKGEYNPQNNKNALINNALVSPFIDLSTVGASDDLFLTFFERRYIQSSADRNIDVQTASGGAWTTVSTVATSSYGSGKTGGWIPAAVDLTGYAGADSLRVRFRAETDAIPSQIYWYVDDLELLGSDADIIDFADVQTEVKSYAIPAKSDTFNVFKMNIFDGNNISLETLFVEIVNISGGLTSSDFAGIANGYASGISVYDSSGARLAINAGESGWNGLVAHVVFSGTPMLPPQPVATSYAVKIRTSTTVSDSEKFQVKLGTGRNIVFSNDEILGLASDVVTDTFLVDNSAPAAPAGLTATPNNDSTQISLVWNSNSENDMAQYKVYRDTTDGFTPGISNLYVTLTVPDTDYTDAGVALDRYYYYRVSAVDSIGGESGYSAQAGAPTNPKPSTPANLSATPNSDSTEINLAWDNNTDGDLIYYYIYRDTANGFTPGSGNLLDSVSGVTTAYNDAGIILGEIYYYRIAAADTVGQISDYSAQVSAPTNPLPAAPTGLTADPTPDSLRITLTWNPNSEWDISYYNIYRDTYFDFIPLPGNLIAQISHPGTVYTDTTVSQGTDYFYKISAVDSVGGESDYSSEVESPVLVVLAGFTAGPVTSGVVLYWSTQSEINNLGWHVYRQLDTESQFRRINQELIPGNGTTGLAHEYEYYDTDVPLGAQKASYYLEQVGLDGTRNQGPVITVDIGNTVCKDGLHANSRPQLVAIRPNPFRGKVSIHLPSNFLGQNPGVFDRNGRLVKILDVGQNLIATWDGTDGDGITMANGIYFCKFNVNGKAFIYQLVKTE